MSYHRVLNVHLLIKHTHFFVSLYQLKAKVVAFLDGLLIAVTKLREEGRGERRGEERNKLYKGNFGEVFKYPQCHVMSINLQKNSICKKIVFEMAILKFSNEIVKMNCLPWVYLVHNVWTLTFTISEMQYTCINVPYKLYEGTLARF